MVHGRPNKLIAFDLGIATRTVEVHRANLMEKLHAKSLSDVLRIAFAAGLGERE
jgi:two-component system response regulator FixJ